jgi:O-acetyl-ADP-ribose deacetylase (regulator of RNase III)
MKIILVDTKAELVEAWRAVGLEEVHHGSIFDYPADAIVSPANSFGFMDGGIDYLYSQRFGWVVQGLVQEKIRQEHGGELLIGQALTVLTGDEEFPTLITAPTMRVPMVIPDPNHVRMATRAAIRTALQVKASSVVLPGMGTGAGRVRPEWAACMMKAGIEDALDPKPFPSSLNVAMGDHYAVKP